MLLVFVSHAESELDDPITPSELLDQNQDGNPDPPQVSELTVPLAFEPVHGAALARVPFCW